MSFEPSYLALASAGELGLRAERLWERLKSCDLCPRMCRVDRTAGQRGFCRVGERVMVSSFGPHFGEEPELVGRHGSGTIFFTSCNLGCVFCQNYDISHLMRGTEESCEELSASMIRLQRMGCHNINLVTPTHFVPQIVRAIALAADAGLRIPIVYNCGGYESIETLKALEGIVDIYMPDIKFSGKQQARKYLNAPDYPEVVKAALVEMHRQVGVLQVDSDGIAYRGLLVRHLVMPGGLAGSGEFARFIAQEISKRTYVNIMAQYHPEYRASEFPELTKSDIWDQYVRAVEEFARFGIKWEASSARIGESGERADACKRD